MSFIEGLSNGFISEVCPMGFFYRRFVQWVSKTKIFCFENSFSYMANACVRESVKTRDMGHGMWTSM